MPGFPKSIREKFKLSRYDVRLIKMHYGLPPYKQPLSFSEIGTRLKIHGNAARILFHSAIRKLKHPINKSHNLHKLIPDLDAPPPPASKKFLYHPPKPSDTINLNLLRSLREKHRLSQNQLADHLSLRHGTYQAAEQGKNHFSLPVFREICRLFNLDPLTISLLLNLPFPDLKTYKKFHLQCRALKVPPSEALKDFIQIFAHPPQTKT